MDTLEGHTFDILTLRQEGEHYLVHIAVDGFKSAPFFEPVSNVYGMTEEQFLPYIKEQALTMADYYKNSGSA